MKKKFLTLLALVTSLAVLTACGEDNDKKRDKSDRSDRTSDNGDMFADLGDKYDDLVKDAKNANSTPKPSDVDPDGGDIPVDTENVSDKFDPFLSGEVTAVIADYDETMLTKDDLYKEVTFDEFTELITYNEYGESATPAIYFSICEWDGEDILLLKYQGMNIDGADDESYTIVAVSMVDDEYNIAFVDSAWSRCFMIVAEDGAVYIAGSAGAGDHLSEIGYLGEHGQYEYIGRMEDCTQGWIGSMFEYLPYGDFSENTISLAKEIDNIDCGDDYIEIALWYIDDELYGVKLSDGYDDELREFMESAEQDGLTWMEVEDINKMIDDSLIAAGCNPDDIEEPDWQLLY